MAKTLVRLLAAGTLALALSWGGLSPLSERPGQWFAPQATVAAAATKQTVKLDPAGGKVAKKSVKVAVGTAFGTLPKPTRTWYRFDGWYTKKSGGTKVTSKTKLAKGTKKLYAHWTKTAVEKMKPGVTYSVKLNGKKTQKVKFTNKWKDSFCTRTFYVNSKRVHSGNCLDGWYEYTLMKMNSTTTLIYRLYYHEWDYPGQVYRFDGTRLVKVKDLYDDDIDIEQYDSVRIIQAGSGRFVMRVRFGSGFDSEAYAWNVTYRYSGGKLSVAKVITNDPRSVGKTTAASRKYMAYCPGSVPGNTTDVSIQAFNHPTWGASTLVVCRPHVSAKYPYRGTSRGVRGDLVVVDSKGKLRWQDTDEQYIFYEHYSLGWGLAEPATDSLGNLFIRYNPGRYNGILAYRPVGNGMKLLGEYYYAELDGVDSAGRARIRQYTNDCQPDCASGTVTTRLLTWNGTTYA